MGVCLVKCFIDGHNFSRDELDEVDNQHLPSANGSNATAEALLLKAIVGGGSVRKIPRNPIKSYRRNHNLWGVVRGTANWTQQGLIVGCQQL